ncbi:MAG: HEAT repeat domain-containing protein [Symploca sp. SIO2G7]|nr:HEAT repeat domain-containing protein [Symploca sp. SIO2G7]
MAISAGIGVLIGLVVGVGITAFLMQRTIRRQDNAPQQCLSRLNRLQEDHALTLDKVLAKSESAALTSTAALPADAAPTNLSVRRLFTPIPDPWAEPGNTSAAVDVPIAKKSATKRPVSVSPKPNQNIEYATELGKAAAISRKTAIYAVPQLGKLTKDGDPDVRLAAVTALQNSGSAKAIPFLRYALRDTDNRVVAAASTALSRFKGAKKPASKAKKVGRTKRRR